MIIKLEVNDAETPVTDLQLSLTTTNPTLITPQVYTFHYFFVDGHRYLTMSGAFGLTGTATNTVTVSDGVNSASTNFTINVVAPPAGTERFANTSPMTIPDLGTGVDLSVCYQRFQHERRDNKSGTDRKPIQS